MSPQTAELIFFVYFCIALPFFSIMVVVARNIINNVLFLLLFLVNTAALFLFLRAEFLMAIQIIVYVGGVLALFIFAIMIMNLKEEIRHSKYVKFYGFGILAGIIFIALLFYAMSDFQSKGTPLVKSDSASLGKLLYSYYLLPFEILSVVLLVALVGGILLAKKLPKEEK